ncbi:MAG: CaiB/BaiF CoA-transferase family protein [Hyphomonadaceae bacterium]|nr:CaiB/BaiF CoA-transferase family protein [Hyphomonadaceae bacterium]
MASGPLKGIKVLEFAGIGPGPFTCMLLSDMGADVVRVDRKGARSAKYDVTSRGRRSVAVDLKSPDGVAACVALAEKADVLLEGFRPGVMERLGLGPDVLHKRNARLVYARMTGWGQSGPLALAAGHDLNYIALTGGLHAMGRADQPPAPPLNLVGDFGGGALYMAMGICAALIEAQRSGKGQTIDCAMTDGAASLAAMFYGMRAAGIWTDARDANLLDGGAHFYDTYETSDGKWVSIGSIEPQFYALLLEKAGLTGDPAFQSQMDRTAWPTLSEKLAAVIRTKTRDAWCALMEGTDVCFAPVLNWQEAPQHPHNVARETFVTVEGVVQPNVAPRFSGTPSKVQGPPPETGAHTESAMRDWGVDAALIDRVAR